MRKEQSQTAHDTCSSTVNYCLGITEQCAVRMCDGFMVKERGRREEWSGTIMIDVNQRSLS